MRTHAQDLSCNELTKVPEDLFHAKNIIVLSLSNNRITSIPGAVRELSSGLCGTLRLEVQGLKLLPLVGVGIVDGSVWLVKDKFVAMETNF